MLKRGIGAVIGVAAAAVGVLGIAGGRVLRRALQPVVFVQPGPEPAWETRLRLVDQALARENVSIAIYEWREAYGAALRSRRWEGLGHGPGALSRRQAGPASAGTW